MQLRKKYITLLYLLFPFQQVFSQSFVSVKKEHAAFSLIAVNRAVPILVDPNDNWLVQKTASLLQTDIESSIGLKPSINTTKISGSKNVIIIGSINQSFFIKDLINAHKLNIDTLQGKWEAYRIQLVSNPFPGINQALVITGSDKRGVAFGVFEFSKQLGVSPWYWWADVPIINKKALYIKQGAYMQDAPSVKYRGIFINDEAPALSGWTKEKFGGVNHQFYEKVFELLLRLKSNYLWPAMWGNAFNDDDTLNPVLADKYGIVMGTSHHEPMLRAQQEWKRYGKGIWNYQSNDSVLRIFWKKGIQNMGTHESIVSIGMRGDGDMPMTQGSNIALLEKIVTDQRKIIEDVTQKPIAATPQLWALYKEVQDYYDKGMRVPDDVTLLLCDDNWGNLRKLPKLTDAPRKGGYGIYYHFDYVGGPRNYKWLNTNPITRIWEQMHLAWEYNVRAIWIVNVGDIKPMEFPISFFLDYAWNPTKIKATDLQKYTQDWAAFQFGEKYAKEIAAIISKYTKFNGRRKPELLDANTYSLENYQEAETVVKEYKDLLDKAEKIKKELPENFRDAYFQLVLHPVKACANLNELYLSVAQNKLAARQHSITANTFANTAKSLFITDSLISLEYNSIANGKWNHMMDQTHIGYTYWQQPMKQKLPELTYVLKDSVTSDQIINKIQSKSALSLIPKNVKANTYFEKDGYVSIGADKYSKEIHSKEISWQVLPDHGKTGSAITAFPVTANTQTLTSQSPHLEYEFYLYDTGTAKINAYLSPTLNFHNTDGLKYAISIDSEQPQIIAINKEDNLVKIWEGWMANNIILKQTSHTQLKSGKHTLKFWMVDPCVVLQKLLVDMGSVKQSYLGPPETIIN